jgi:hypothetical protein
MFNVKILFILLIFCVVLINTSAQSEKRIKFKRGESSATIKGAAPRGEVVNYVLKAAKDQSMKISIASVENNAVFQVKDLSTGYYLSNAGELDDAMEWEGVLPTDGEYRIIVGTTRGGAEYTLKVTIK